VTGGYDKKRAGAWVCLLLCLLSPAVDVNLDTADRPLIRVTLGEAPSAEAFAQLFVDLELELRQGAPIGLLVDARTTKSMSLAHVKQFAGFGKRNHDLVAEKIRALAMVIPSAMVRGALKAALQLNTPPHPFEVFQEFDAGLAMLQPYLDGAGS